MSISVCLVVKNEEKNIRGCLESVKFADEVILVDTGSIDKTIEIAKEFDNVKVYKKKFNIWYFKNWKLKKLFHFSNARNYGLSKATKEWILILDADERIENPEHIQNLLDKKLDIQAWRFNQVTATAQGDVPCSSTRFWLNGLGIKYRKIVHETVDEYLDENKLRIGTTDIVIRHVDYDSSGKDRVRSERIIDAIKKEKQPYMNYYLGVAYHQAGDIETAVDYFNLAIQDNMAPNIKAHAHAVLADLYRQTANFYKDMARERIKSSKELVPEQNLSHLIMAEIYKSEGNGEMAKKQYEHLLSRDTMSSKMHQDLLVTKEQINLMMANV